MSLSLINNFFGWTIGQLRLSTFPPTVYSGPLLILFSSLLAIALPFVKNKSALISYDLCTNNFPYE